MPVKDESEGCMANLNTNQRLTVPHSVSMIDFDGDCMADLFMTIQDVSTGRKFYEIYIRREISESIPISN